MEMPTWINERSSADNVPNEEYHNTCYNAVNQFPIMNDGILTSNNHQGNLQIAESVPNEQYSIRIRYVPASGQFSNH